MSRGLGFIMTALAAIFFLEGCASLKPNIPSTVRAQGESDPLWRLEDAAMVSRIAKEEARQKAVENMFVKIRRMYVTPWTRAGELMDKNPALKMEVIKLIGQARQRKMRYLRGDSVMIELELDGERLKELFSTYR